MLGLTPCTITCGEKECYVAQAGQYHSVAKGDPGLLLLLPPSPGAGITGMSQHSWFNEVVRVEPGLDAWLVGTLFAEP